MKKRNLDKTLDRMVKQLIKTFDPDQIILSGTSPYLYDGPKSLS